MSEPITDADLARLRAICEAATPGKWLHQVGVVGSRDGTTLKEHFVMRDGDDIAIAADIADPTTNDGDPSPANAAFIAASREWLPRLLDEVERLRDGWKRMYDSLTEQRNEAMDQRDEARAEVDRLRDEAAAWGGELENYRAICALLGRDTITDRAHDDLDAAICFLRDAGHAGKCIDDAVLDLVAERDAARAENAALKAELARMGSSLTGIATARESTFTRDDLINEAAGCLAKASGGGK